MQSDWLFIGLFLLIVALFPGAPILIAGLIGPHKPSVPKAQTMSVVSKRLVKPGFNFGCSTIYLP
jgi:hypothetical protein